MFLEKQEIVQRERFFAHHEPIDYRIFQRKRGDIQCVEELFKSGFILNVIEHFCQRHQPDAFDGIGDERIEVIAALLTVADDVHAVFLLEFQAFQHRCICDAIKFGFGDAAFLSISQCPRDLP